MDFQEFIESQKVILGEKDLQKSKALIKMADNNFKSLQTVPLNKNTASMVFTMYYECLRQILEAVSLMQGYKVYSHEAYTAYLVTLKEFSISAKFDRLRKLRNGINYYGKAVTEEVTKNTKDEVKEMMQTLKTKYLCTIL